MSADGIRRTDANQKARRTDANQKARRRKDDGDRWRLSDAATLGLALLPLLSAALLLLSLPRLLGPARGSGILDDALGRAFRGGIPGKLNILYHSTHALDQSTCYKTVSTSLHLLVVVIPSTS
jgi:hypothetical protein